MYGKQNPVAHKYSDVNGDTKYYKPMIILLENPLYVVDSQIQPVFADLCNALYSSTTPAETHRQIHRMCSQSGHHNPDNYFKWGFDGPHFWLKQRLEYQSEACFEGRLLTVLHYTPPTRLPIKN